MKKLNSETSSQTKAHAFTSTSFTLNLHHSHTDRRSRTISKKKEFLPCPLLPRLGLCRPLLAQTSTTPYTEAHRHRGHQSCAWTLETYRSRREPRSKGLFFLIFPFPQFGFQIILMVFFCFLFSDCFLIAVRRGYCKNFS